MQMFPVREQYFAIPTSVYVNLCFCPVLSMSTYQPVSLSSSVYVNLCFCPVLFMSKALIKSTPDVACV